MYELKNIDQNGIAIIRNFFNEEALRILESNICDVAHGLAAAADLKIGADRVSGEIDRLLVDVVRQKPILQGLVYDRLQQMPDLLAVPAREEVRSIAHELLGTNRVGVWPRVQLRMDLHDDRRNLIRWHNDYIYNRGTVHSYTFWFPISNLTDQMGLLKFAVGSHNLHLTPKQTDGPERFKFDLPDDVVSKLNVVTPEVHRRDLVVFHSLLWHTGQINKAVDRARLSGLFRLQNLERIEADGSSNEHKI